MTVSIKQHFKHAPTQESIEFKRIMNAVLADMAAIRVEMAANKALYDAHVHTADGNASRTSAPDSGTPTGSPSAASAFSAATALTLES